MFRLVSSAIKKHPWIVVACSLLMTGVLAIGVGRLGGDVSYYSLLPSDFASVKAIKELNSRLGGTGYESVLIRAPSVTDSRIIMFLLGLEDKIREDDRFNRGQIQMLPGKKGKEVPIILSEPVPVVMSYLSPFIANIKKGIAQTGLYLPLSRLTDEMVRSIAGKTLRELVEQDYLSNPSVKASMVGRNGFITPDYRAALVMFKVGASLSDRQQVKLANDLEDFMRSELKGVPGVRINVSGDATIARDFDSHIRNKTILLFLVGLLLVFAILFLSFRRLSDTLIPFVFMVLSLLCTLGFMGWAGIRYSIASVAMLPLLLGTSLTFIVPFMARYYESIEHHFRSVAAVSFALKTIGGGILLAAVTNIFGFAVFQFSVLPPLKQFGISCAVGTAFSFLLATTLLPAVMTVRDARYEETWARGEAKRETHFDGLSRRKKRSVFARITSNALGSLSSLSILHSGSVILIFALLIAAGFSQIHNLKTDSDLRRLVPENLPGIKSDYLTEKYFGGRQQDIIIVKGNVLERTSLEAILRLGNSIYNDSLNDYKGGKVYSYRGIKSVAKVLSDLNNGVLPETREKAEELIAAAEDNGAFVTGSLISKDRRFGIISLDGIGAETTEMVDRKLTMLRNNTGEILKGTGLKYLLGGITPLTKDLTKNIIPTEVISSAVSLLLCAMVLIMLFRSFAFGLITMSVACAGVAAELGFISIMRWPIDIITSLSSALVIGVGVNFGILFTHRYKQELGRGSVSPADAIRITMSNLGGANIVAATASVAAFLIIMLSDIVPLKRFGGVIAFAIGACIVASLTLMPALLYRFSGHKAVPEEEAVPEVQEIPRGI